MKVCPSQLPSLNQSHSSEIQNSDSLKRYQNSEGSFRLGLRKKNSYKLKGKVCYNHNYENNDWYWKCHYYKLNVTMNWIITNWMNWKYIQYTNWISWRNCHDHKQNLVHGFFRYCDQSLKKLIFNLVLPTPEEVNTRNPRSFKLINLRISRSNLKILYFHNMKEKCFSSMELCK